MLESFEMFKKAEEIRIKNIKKILDFDCIEAFNEFIVKEVNKDLCQ